MVHLADNLRGLPVDGMRRALLTFGHREQTHVAAC